MRRIFIIVITSIIFYKNGGALLFYFPDKYFPFNENTSSIINYSLSEEQQGIPSRLGYLFDASSSPIYSNGVSIWDWSKWRAYDTDLDYSISGSEVMNMGISTATMFFSETMPYNPEEGSHRLSSIIKGIVQLDGGIDFLKQVFHKLASKEYNYLKIADLIKDLNSDIITELLKDLDCRLYIADRLPEPKRRQVGELLGLDYTQIPDIKVSFPDSKDGKITPGSTIRITFAQPMSEDTKIYIYEKDGDSILKDENGNPLPLQLNKFSWSHDRRTLTISYRDLLKRFGYYCTDPSENEIFQQPVSRITEILDFGDSVSLKWNTEYKLVIKGVTVDGIFLPDYSYSFKTIPDPFLKHTPWVSNNEPLFYRTIYRLVENGEEVRFHIASGANSSSVMGSPGFSEDPAPLPDMIAIFEKKLGLKTAYDPENKIYTFSGTVDSQRFGKMKLKVTLTLPETPSSLDLFENALRDKNTVLVQFWGHSNFGNYHILNKNGIPTPFNIDELDFKDALRKEPPSDKERVTFEDLYTKAMTILINSCESGDYIQRYLEDLKDYPVQFIFSNIALPYEVDKNAEIFEPIIQGKSWEEIAKTDIYGVQVFPHERTELQLYVDIDRDGILDIFDTEFSSQDPEKFKLTRAVKIVKTLLTDASMGWGPVLWETNFLQQGLSFQGIEWFRAQPGDNAFLYLEMNEENQELKIKVNEKYKDLDLESLTTCLLYFLSRELFGLFYKGSNAFMGENEDRRIITEEGEELNPALPEEIASSLAFKYNSDWDSLKEHFFPPIFAGEISWDKFVQEMRLIQDRLIKVLGLDGSDLGDFQDILETTFSFLNSSERKVFLTYLLPLSREQWERSYKVDNTIISVITDAEGKLKDVKVVDNIEEDKKMVKDLNVDHRYKTVKYSEYLEVFNNLFGKWIRRLDTMHSYVFENGSGERILDGINFHQTRVVTREEMFENVEEVFDYFNGILSGDSPKYSHAQEILIRVLLFLKNNIKKENIPLLEAGDYDRGDKFETIYSYQLGNDNQIEITFNHNYHRYYSLFIRFQDFTLFIIHEPYMGFVMFRYDSPEEQFRLN